MKDDIKSEPASQSQFQQSANPPKTVDGISPPATHNPQVSNQLAINAPAIQPSEPLDTTKEPVSQPAPNNQKQNSDQPPTPNKIKKKHNIFPALTAVVILLALSSLAVYVGLIRNDKTSDNGLNEPAQQQNTSQASENQALQETIQQIDKLPEDTDTSGNQLTDKDLGL